MVRCRAAAQQSRLKTRDLVLVEIWILLSLLLLVRNAFELKKHDRNADHDRILKSWALRHWVFVLSDGPVRSSMCMVKNVAVPYSARFGSRVRLCWLGVWESEGCTSVSWLYDWIACSIRRHGGRHDRRLVCSHDGREKTKLQQYFIFPRHAVSYFT